MDARARIDRLLGAAVAAGVVPGVVALAVTSDRVIYEGAAGWRSPSDRTLMSLDAVFAIASMTKPLVAAAAMQLVEQERIGLDEPLDRFDPYLRAPQVLDGFDAAGVARLRAAKRGITLRQLLTHTSGFAYPLWDDDLRRYSEQAGLPPTKSGRLASLYAPLRFDPGERWQYGIGIDWVGRIIEAVSGDPLDAYLSRHLYAPLGMTDTGHQLRPDQRHRLALMHARTSGGGLAVVPWEPPGPREFVPGGGGCYSTARDYLTFLRMLLNGGRFGDVDVLRPATVAMMADNHIGALAVPPLKSTDRTQSADVEFFPGIGKTWGLSFLINTEDLPGRRHAGSLSWAGLGNTYFWVDRRNRTAAVLFTQVLPFGDPAVMDLLDTFERAVTAG